MDQNLHDLSVDLERIWDPEPYLRIEVKKRRKRKKLQQITT
jgi:hypothetical protein